MILVTGATGNVGREVVNLLLEDGEKVAAVTRDPATAALPGGATSWAATPPARDADVGAARRRGGPGQPARPRGRHCRSRHRRLLALAAAQGVQRVVALSAATVEYPAGYRRFADAFRAVEDAVKASGLPWTILRSTDYAATPWPGRRRFARPASCAAPTATRRPRRSTSGTSRRSPPGRW